MRPFILEENNWQDVSTRSYQTALLPWGATEAHNWHLPYGTDNYQAVYVAHEAAKVAWQLGTQSVVLPAISYGVNSGQMDIPLCMNLYPTTQLAILSNIIEVLLRAGIPRLIIVNAHGGNQFQPLIRELSLKYPKMMVAALNWYMAVNDTEYFNEPGEHAGALETSIMQVIHPELVLPLEQAGKGTERPLKAIGFKEKWAWIPRRWIYTTQDTGVGNPAEASVEKGERFLKASIEKVGQFIVAFAAAESEEALYE